MQATVRDRLIIVHLTSSPSFPTLLDILHSPNRLTPYVFYLPPPPFLCSSVQLTLFPTLLPSPFFSSLTTATLTHDSFQSLQGSVQCCPRVLFSDRSQGQHVRLENCTILISNIYRYLRRYFEIFFKRCASARI